jgi:DNA-binding PadR family transcriptional regulator
MEDLTGLEIKILLKCAQQVVSKTVLSNSFRTASLAQRYEAAEKLVKLGFVKVSERPNPTATVIRKTPVLYEISEKGRDWVEQYNQKYA